MENANDSQMKVLLAGDIAPVRQPVDRLGDYWPDRFAPGGREWSVANISTGKLDIAAEFALKGRLGAL